MIVVTGATGGFGRGVVEALLARVPAGSVVASVRDPGRAGDLATRRGGPTRRLRRAGHARRRLRRRRPMLIVSVDQFGGAARALHRQVIAAARDAGASRLFYTSHMGAHPGSPFADHSDAEAALAETDVSVTSLRHGFYAESAMHLIGSGIADGVIRAPADGPVSWTARADLAEADAALLAGEPTFDGQTPPLTANRTFTMAEIVEAASDITGRTIRREVVSDGDWRAQAIAGGAPAAMADTLLGMYRAARNGELAATDPLLGKLIGRAPWTMADVLAEVLRR